MPSGAPLFRRQALEYYIQSSERTVLPRLVRPPVFLLLWILLGLAAITMAVTWFGKVPIYISGFGIVAKQTISQNGQLVTMPVALIFVPTTPEHALALHVSAPVLLRIGAQGHSFPARVYEVEPTVLSPDEIQKLYAPGSNVSSMIKGPSMVISIQLGLAFAYQSYAGSLVNAQIQVGSTSMFSSLFDSALNAGG